MTTIWLAGDHLLVRESTYGLSESYKRFYFRDVQAIIVRRSPRWIGWICVWAIFCVLFLLFYSSSHGKGWGWLACSAISFVLVMIQLIRGPTCVTHLVTAVQRELLGSLNTVRKARHALKTLVPLIEEKQGALDPAALEAAPPPVRPSMGTGAAIGASQGLLPTTAPIPQPVAIPTLGWSWPHLLLFGTTLLGGCVALWESYRPSSLSIVVAAILLAGILVLSVVALVSQGRRRVKKSIAVLTWTIMIGYIVAWLVIYSVYAGIHSLQRAAERAKTNKPPEIMTELSPGALRQMPGFDYVLVVYGICSVGLGLAGMGTMLGRRPRPPEPSSMPPASASAP
jgi:hypothetical protein